jgi:hypothetical protein
MSAIGTTRTIQTHPRLSAVGVTADKAGFWPAMVCPLMTQSGHAGPVIIRNERHDENGEGIGVSDLSTLILDFFVFFAAFFAAFFSAFAAIFNSFFFLPINPSRSRVTASFND